MKKKWMLLLVAAIGLITFSSCSDDDNDGAPEGTHLVSKEVQSAFNTKYPQARDVEWKLKGNYAVVDFDWNGSGHSAWFDPASASWYMTETDIRYDDLPQPVKAAHEAGEYATWKRDDVDMLVREGMETLYVIEVENGNTDVDLFYSPSGVLVKSVVNTDQDPDYDDYLPQPEAQTIIELVKQMYPDARIVEIDREKNGVTEVEILDGMTCRELYFDKENVWLRTMWEVRLHDLPAPVKEAVKLKYQDYVIDDADHVKTPSGNWYELDLENERTDHEIDNVKITADGTWIN